jgi:iodotyrosine deiodinase
MSAKMIPYSKDTYPETEVLQRSREHLSYMDKRRTVREFSSQPIPDEVIRNILMAASTAPSGAHKQPWKFCVVTSADMKRKIREAAEEEEYKSYNGRMSEEWLEDLSYLGTDWHKPFLEVAPALIVVFRKSYDVVDGRKRTNYYVSESVGLACGFLLEAIHYCGLVALTHTPSPMNFLCKLLNRPEHEKPFLLIPVGYPADNTIVPDLKRKTEEEVTSWYR